MLHLRERKKNYIHILVPPMENVIRWKILAHRSLTLCHTSAVEIGQFTVDQWFFSSSMRKFARGFEGQSLTKGYSRIMLNIEDPEVSQGKPEIPLDNQYLYIKLQPYISTLSAFASFYTNILIVPTTELFSRELPYIMVGGNAPGITAVADTPPSETFMKVSLPRQSLFFSISNSSTTEAIIVAFDKGSPTVSLPAGYESSTTDAGVSDFYVASASGNVVPFIVNASMKSVR
jgi:hypothetical protein